MLRHLWAYREFILSCVKREFQQRYRKSLLGSLWAVLEPLAMIFVYTVIFSQIMKAKLPNIDSTFAYSIYLCAGVFTWNLFAEIVQNSCNIFLANANTLKKVEFPKICLPAIVALNAMINFGIVFALYLVSLVIIGYFPGVELLYIPVLLAVIIAFSASLGLFLGVFNVFFRDVGHMLGVVMQFWFWFTPVVYTYTIIPEAIQPFLFLNPVYPVINGFQKVFVEHQSPDFFWLGYSVILTLIIMVLALRIYRKHIGEVVDEL